MDGHLKLFRLAMAHRGSSKGHNPLFSLALILGITVLAVTAAPMVASF